MARILVVEDDPVAAKIVERVIAGAGHHVECAENGQLAIDALERSDFDLMMTDLMMPAKDGEVLCRWVRQQPRTLGLPIFLMTGSVDSRVRSWAEELRVEILEKPIKLSALLPLIDLQLSKTAEPPFYPEDSLT